MGGIAQCPPLAAEPNIYGPTFWIVYAANTCLNLAMSILFRYADFVTNLEGSELTLGLIIGAGTVGSLAMRVFQGAGIDRFGPRRVWLLSLILMTASLLGHIQVTSLDGPAVYLLRIMLATGLAGAFGASITYITLCAPRRRIGETVGMLGTSGFLGIAFGPVLGDWLLGESGQTRGQVDRMFLVAAAMTFLSLVLATVATRGHRGTKARRGPPLWHVLRRYQPGAVLLVGMAMGVGIGLPHIFLRTYTAQLDISSIKLFFLVYATVAFTVRIATRRLTDRWGPRPVICVGLASLSAMMLLFLVVANEWMLAIPAVMGGVGHALLFPAVVADVSAAFPRRYRGLATSLMMATFDVGNLVGQPAVGAMIEGAQGLGLPPYATMFVTVSAVLLGLGAFYAQSKRRVPRSAWQAAVAAEPAPPLIGDVACDGKSA
jgi:MFS family permease